MLFQRLVLLLILFTTNLFAAPVERVISLALTSQSYYTLRALEISWLL